MCLNVQTHRLKSLAVGASRGNRIVLCVVLFVVRSVGWIVFPSQSVSWEMKYTLWNLRTLLKETHCEGGSMFMISSIKTLSRSLRGGTETSSGNTILTR